MSQGDTMYFKILRLSDNGIFDIIYAKNRQDALAQADAGCDIPFRLVEATHSEYLRWTWIDWNAVDAFERDIESVCGF
jgi:hypothetical protein